MARENLSILSKLGEGAFGEVFEASMLASRGSKSPCTVAVKSLRADASQSEQVEFLREGTRMQRLDHPFLVKLLAVCLDQPPLLILEFMSLGDLKGLILHPKACQRLQSESGCLSICADLASALVFLEQLGVVHRDIAARNVLANSKEVFKFGDFGLDCPVFL